MKVFTPEDSNWHSLNFVDDNNVIVGYDYLGQCCENFGYWISPISNDKNDLSENSDDFDLEGYNFDPEYHKEYFGGEYEPNNEIEFRLVKEGQSDLFLVLYNYHNGYYSHGFEFKKGDTVITEGSL